MEKLIPIEFPVKGLVEAWSFSDQPEKSAREFQNMRIQDCKSGRLAGAQRAGLSKYLTAPLKTEGTKVQDLTSIIVDNRQVSYTAIVSGSETSTWSNTVPSSKTVLNLKTDRQGNVYALDGNAGLVKYSADGELIWQLTLPVADPRHIVRALALDEFDNIYVGVSTGSSAASNAAVGSQDNARLWAYRQVVDQAPEQLWQLEPKAYTEEMLVNGGRLYTVQNRKDRKKSYVRIYDFITTVDPKLTKEWRVPHPVNSIAVKADGSVITASEPSTGDTVLHWRDPDPLYPESFPDSVDWTPQQLENSNKRIWSWRIGDSIDQTDVVSDIEDGVEVSRWRDSSRGGRDLFAPYADGKFDVGPNLAIDGYLEHQALRFSQPFNTTNTDAPPFQALKSNPNASTARQMADQQETLLPGYSNSAWAAFIAVRPSQTSGSSNSLAPSWLFGQDRDNGASGSRDHIVFLNASSSNDNALPPATSSGRVFWFTGQDTTSGGDGFSGQIKEGRFDIRNNSGKNPDATTTNLGQYTLISMLWDGAVTGSNSLFNINGNPIDSFFGRTAFTTKPSYVGIWRATNAGATNPSSGVEGLKGDIVEILALDLKNRNAPTENVLTYDVLQASSVAASQTINEWTTIQGYFMHKYGAQVSLPYSNALVNNYPHPFGITGSGQDRLSGPPKLNTLGTAVEVSAAQALANKRWGCVVKYTADGRIVWCANEQELLSGNRSGGYGYAVAVNSDGNIYSVGPAPLGTGSAEVEAVRLIIDQGTDFSIQTADGAWADYLSSVELPRPHHRIDVDEFDNLYVPLSEHTIIYKKDGTKLHDLSVTAQAVAVDRRIPDYRNDLTNKTAESVFVAISAAVSKKRLVSSAQVAGSTRSLIVLGVSGGNVVTFSPSGVTTPTGGSGALDSTAKYVQSTTLYKKAYFTDGRQLKQYDPTTDTVSEYKSLSSGAMPSRCALIESWRGRIVLARSADEPHNWFLSKKDDPTNWDFFPPTPTEIDAVAGNNSLAGLCPDIINSVVPYSEDILVFGGDHSIWMLVGDPAAGGRLELVSDITGMAFGRPWCKDPNGLLYFVGSRGGLFKWAPGAKPERISLYKIERQLQEIDFGTNYVRLVWNYQDEGLHIFQCPFGSGGAQLSHWFWEQKPDAFAKDLFGTSVYTNVQPTAVSVIDGDSFDDRVLLVGGEDGHVRQWDSDARSDDTRTDLTTKIPIDSFLTIFPIQPPAELARGMETQFHGLTVVLGDREAGCRYELFSSDEPDSFGISRKAGNLGPGRNAPRWDKVVGAYCGLRLRNASAEERWSWERGYIQAIPAGAVRPRATN